MNDNPKGADLLWVTSVIKHSVLCFFDSLSYAKYENRVLMSVGSVKGSFPHHSGHS